MARRFSFHDGTFTGKVRPAKGKKMRQSAYTVRTQSGITFQIEASSYAEARIRASDPAIKREITRMIVEAISNITEVEPSRGPARGKLMFDDAFFR